MKILILRFSSIGDIVLTSPIIRCIKIKYPNTEIHFLSKEKFKDVTINNPYINKHFYFKSDVQPIVLELIKEKYDVIIDLQNNLKSLYIKRILKQVFNSRIQSFTVNKINVRKFLLTKFKFNTLPDKSIVERYFDTVKNLHVINDGQGLDYFINENEETTKDDIPMGHLHGFVACNIGGAHFTKKMPVEKWKELCAKIEFPIILLGGEEDRENGDMIKEIDDIKIYNACGKFSLNESAHLIKRSRFVISHDTGLMHIAAAFKKSIISIWGNTVPEFGMYPYYGFNNLKTTISPLLFINEVKLSCRPCSKIGYKQCPKKHFNCMQKQNIDNILLQTKKVIASLHA
jgi:heptosyltransferase-2